MATPPSRYILGSLPWYSILIALGAAVAIVLASREARRIGLPKDTIIDLALWVLPIGILGGRLYYVLFSWHAYRDHPLSALYIWEGGMAIYGALIAGFLTLVVFCRKRKIPLLLMCDIIVPGVVLAQAIGRWGNYFNQEAYGLPVTNPAFCFFPLAVLIQEGGHASWHMATFFYESAANFCVFLFLLWGRRKLFRHRGDVFFSYLYLYGALRLIIENFRMDSLYAGSTIRVSQLLSACICGTLTVLALLRYRREHERMPEKTGLLHFIGLVISWITVMYTVLLILFCIRPDALPIFSPRDQFLFLLGYSLSGVTGMLLIELPPRPSEVLYAHHKV